MSSPVGGGAVLRAELANSNDSDQRPSGSECGSRHVGAAASSHGELVGGNKAGPCRDVVTEGLEELRDMVRPPRLFPPVFPSADESGTIGSQCWAYICPHKPTKWVRAEGDKYR
jgi:hypothetical protein